MERCTLIQSIGKDLASLACAFDLKYFLFYVATKWNVVFSKILQQYLPRVGFFGNNSSRALRVLGEDVHVAAHRLQCCYVF